MFKVNISNSSKNLSWSAKFPTETEANEWLQKQIGKPHRLPAELTYEVIDLSKDSVWVEKDIQEKRRKEYPGELEVIEALREAVGENRPQKLQEIQAKIEAIKIKYPKVK